MSCFGRAAVPVKRVWLGISSRLRLRRPTGLRKLRKDVRTCQYSDVHIMWEMLRKPERRGGAAGKKKAAWSRLFSYCCAF